MMSSSFYLIDSSGNIIKSFGSSSSSKSDSSSSSNGCKHAAARLVAVAIDALLPKTAAVDDNIIPEVLDFHLPLMFVVAGFISCVGLAVMGTIGASSAPSCPTASDLRYLRLNVYHLSYLLAALHASPLRALSCRLKASPPAVPLLSPLPPPPASAYAPNAAACHPQAEAGRNLDAYTAHSMAQEGGSDDVEDEVEGEADDVGDVEAAAWQAVVEVCRLAVQRLAWDAEEEVTGSLAGAARRLRTRLGPASCAISRAALCRPQIETNRSPHLPH